MRFSCKTSSIGTSMATVFFARARPRRRVVFSVLVDEERFVGRHTLLAEEVSAPLTTAVFKSKLACVIPLGEGAASELRDVGELTVEGEILGEIAREEFIERRLCHTATPRGSRIPSAEARDGAGEVSGVASGERRFPMPSSSNTNLAREDFMRGRATTHTPKG